LIGAVALLLLAHHEAMDRTRGETARHDRHHDWHRAELEAADGVDVGVGSKQPADDLGDERSAFRIEGRGLEIEVVVAGRARRELEGAAQQRLLFDDREEPRSRILLARPAGGLHLRHGSSPQSCISASWARPRRPYVVASVSSISKWL